MSSPEHKWELRLEAALQLLPNVDSLVELRQALIRGSRLQVPSQPEGTIGKRVIYPADLDPLLRDTVTQSKSHLSRLYEAAIDAIDALQRDDSAAAVHSLVIAGELEERLDRHSQAFQWYERALDAARPLRDRQPEMDVLCHMGRLQSARERLEEAARCFQRALALAESESDRRQAAAACQGLGDLAMAQGRWAGAESWYRRGAHHAEGDERVRATLLLGLAEAARQRGEHDLALRHLEVAWERFETLGDRWGMARALNENARLRRSRGHLQEASTLHQRALTHAHALGRDTRLETIIHLDLSRLYLDWGRARDAEDECRQAESCAIAGNHTRELALTYLSLGRLRAGRGDESGFIFFENAIALCRGREPLPRLEAEIYLEYGMFREGLGEMDEANAYIFRARDILESLGEDALLPRVRTMLAQFGSN